LPEIGDVPVTSIKLMLPCCCCCCFCCYADVTDASCIVSTLLAAYLPIGFISRKPCAAHSSLLTIHTAQLSTRRQSILCYVGFTFGCFAGLSVCPDYDHVLRSCRLVTNRFKLVYTIPPGRVPVLCQALRIFGYYKYALLFVLCVCLSAMYLSVTRLLQEGVVRFLCNLGCLLILWSSCAECNFPLVPLVPTKFIKTDILGLFDHHLTVPRICK